MKEVSRVAIVAAAMITVAAMSGAVAQVPQAQSNWPREALLCLANPNGATALAECRPPIDRLRQHLTRGRPFPSCTMSDGRDTQAAGAYGQVQYTHYDRCPTGTNELPAGELATAAPPASSPIYAGIGSGDGLQPSHSADQGLQQLPLKICVGPSRGLRQMYDDRTETWVMVEQFEPVVVMEPYYSGQVIDVYIDNQVYTRVRW